MSAAAAIHLRTGRSRRVKPVLGRLTSVRLSVAFLAGVFPSGLSFADGLPGEVLRSSLAYESDIETASRRFGVPESWIRVVLHAESRGQPRAISPAGAMGLMQIMPGTWLELRGRYGLGSDPFAPRDNILAGTAYLGELHARFGAPGFLAAYNAGPGRYTEHLTSGRALPAETIAYVAEIAPRLEMPVLPATAGKVSPIDYDRAGAQLFIRGSGARAKEARTPFEGAFMRAFKHPDGAQDVRRAGIFVGLPRTSEQPEPDAYR